MNKIMNRQEKFTFDYGVTREQACIMCHLSSECGGCCNKCRAEGRNGSCYGQVCSQPNREHQGMRWNAWMNIVATAIPELRRFVPKKYIKALKREYGSLYVKTNKTTNKTTKLT